MIRQFDSQIELMEAFPDEQSCVDHLRSIRWKHREFCPFCGHGKIYHFADNRTNKCAACRKRFSIKVGTIFEETKLPLRKCFVAIWMITSHKKGIASTQLAKDLKITQKSAWFVLHRLRHAARTKSFNRPLKGEVEIDETFVGGKEGNKHASKRGKGVKKAVVFGMLERGGELRVAHIPSLRHVRRTINENVAAGSTVMSDDWPGYIGLNGRYHHHTVNHSAGEYVRSMILHVNGLEGAWSLFKRQINGTHHWVSQKHLGP
jgi:transposase-like protein